jgi:hypothetical protein
MKKSVLILLACIAGIIIFQAFTTHNEPVFKNLQILPKDISKHDLDSVMHTFTASLGVKCNFCHVRNDAERKMDFASDDKPEKHVARKMMLMSIDINKNYFKNMEHAHDMDSSMTKDEDHNSMDTTNFSEPARYMFRTVTCFTCHRGDPHPDSKIPEMMPEGPGMQKPPSQNK